MRKLPLAGALLALLFIVLTQAVGAGLFEWSRLGRLTDEPGPQPYVSVITPHPTRPEILYAGALLTTDDAALVYRSADGGETWSAIAAGLPPLPAFTGVKALLLWPGEGDAADTLLVALQGGGIWRSSDGGATWTTAAGGALGGGATVIGLQSTATRTLALTAEGIYGVLRNGKWKLQAVGLPPAGATFYYDLAADPTDPDVVYVAAGVLGIFRSADGGGSWAAANGDLPGPPYNAREVSVNPLTGELFASLRGAGLFRSADGGQTWVASQTGITFETTPYGAVGAPVISPGDGLAAYVYNSDGIFRSEDGGRTWSPYAEGLSGAETISALAFHPARPNTILAGTSISGVWNLTLTPGGRQFVPLVR